MDAATVLMVEDDVMNRELITEALSRDRYRVTTVDSGAADLERAGFRD